MTKSVAISSFAMLLLAPYLAISQARFKEIIPASPTTASLGKYGEVPVNIHTGLPNISVPIIQLSGKDLSIDISLSYHAGGIKVEEIASWAGLGWSLFAGGVITREVRGLSDDHFAGFLNKTVETSDFSDDIVQNSSNVLNGIADFEPDIFYFDLSGETGRFWYDDAKDQFVCDTKNRKKIFYSSASLSFKIVDEDGAEYHFLDIEENSTGNSCATEAGMTSVVTGWYLSKIINANKTDSILFQYVQNTYSFDLRQSMEKRFITEFSESCTNMGVTPSLTCFRNNQISAPRLISIAARSGRVKFEADTLQPRTDLPGDHALKRIKVFNEKNELLYTYHLNHDYFWSGEGVGNSHYRLRLLGINLESNGKTQTVQKFEYTDSYFPDRYSFGQDYWGYYNGVESNNHLVPSEFFITSNGPIMLEGANRGPAPTAQIAQVGMLKKVIYPTGGYTEFDYENHRVENNPFNVAMLLEAVHLDRGTEPSGTTVFSTTFTIDYGPNLLNGDNPDGGAFVDFLLDVPCYTDSEIPPEATDQCIITLSGPIGFTITGNIPNSYLPNGVYTLTADFSNNISNPPDWFEFYAGVKWHYLDTTHTPLVGGLRIKKIVDYDPLTSGIARIKRFRYHVEDDTTVSSASFNGRPTFKTPIWYRKIEQCPPPQSCSIADYCQMYKITATSAYPVMGSNSHITYGFVTAYDDEDGLHGKTTFRYHNPLDPQGDNIYPYLPLDDNAWQRGMLAEQKEYSFNDDEYELVKSVRNTFDITPFGETSPAIRVYPVKSGIEIQYLNAGSQPEDADYVAQGHYGVQSYYLVHGKYISIDSTITTLYSSENPTRYVRQTEKNFIDNNLNLKRKTATASDGSVLVTHYAYVDDYTNIGTDEVSLAIQTMKNRNMVGKLIEESLWRRFSSIDSTLISAKLVMYKIEDEKIFQNKSFHLAEDLDFIPANISNSHFAYDQDYVHDVEVTRFDDVGNMLEAIGVDGVKFSFIWNVAKTHPIAIAKGAACSDIFYTSFEDDDVSSIQAGGVTGVKCSNTSFTVNIPGGGMKRLTYWIKTGSGPWQFVDAQISASTVIGGAGSLIDEVRVYPTDAEMSTYTYKSGMGVSSIADANNMIQYFEYDEFGRLVITKDSKGNLVKAFKYHYKQQ